MDFLEDETNIEGGGGMGLNEFCFYNEWSKRNQKNQNCVGAVFDLAEGDEFNRHALKKSRWLGLTEHGR